MALSVVFAYDVSEDRRRARLAATLQAHGDRIQRSVFLASVEPEAMRQLSLRVGEIIDRETDSVYVFRQCASCWDAVIVHGQATVEDEPPYWAVL